MHNRPILNLFLILLFCSCTVPIKKEISIQELKYPEKLGVIRRAEWGWKPLKTVLPQHEITKITIHHGGVDYPPDKDPVEHIRNLQDWSRSEKKWIDIPYHFMIAPSGTIYETRPINYPGATNTDYDPSGHALICLMDNYENATVNQEQLKSIIELTAYLVGRFNVPLYDIKGHKDYTETLCPGKNLYQYLENGTIQARVQELLPK
ncbi:MAG: peptidoglycan recognition family protein [Candidatus Marinimicrobia bacterium]|nr:peptidoglycan recognition family protein [Candidatus Neomarinimicrobiota bacterium]